MWETVLAFLYGIYDLVFLCVFFIYVCLHFLITNAIYAVYYGAVYTADFVSNHLVEAIPFTDGALRTAAGHVQAILDHVVQSRASQIVWPVIRIPVEVVAYIFWIIVGAVVFVSSCIWYVVGGLLSWVWWVVWGIICGVPTFCFSWVGMVLLLIGGVAFLGRIQKEKKSAVVAETVSDLSSLTDSIRKYFQMEEEAATGNAETEGGDSPSEDAEDSQHSADSGEEDSALVHSPHIHSLHAGAMPDLELSEEEPEEKGHAGSHQRGASYFAGGGADLHTNQRFYSRLLDQGDKDESLEASDLTRMQSSSVENRRPLGADGKPVWSRPHASSVQLYNQKFKMSSRFQEAYSLFYNSAPEHTENGTTDHAEDTDSAGGVHSPLLASRMRGSSGDGQAERPVTAHSRSSVLAAAVGVSRRRSQSLETPAREGVKGSPLIRSRRFHEGLDSSPLIPAEPMVDASGKPVAPEEFSLNGTAEPVPQGRTRGRSVYDPTNPPLPQPVTQSPVTSTRPGTENAERSAACHANPLQQCPAHALVMHAHESCACLYCKTLSKSTSIWGESLSKVSDFLVWRWNCPLAQAEAAGGTAVTRASPFSVHGAPTSRSKSPAGVSVSRLRDLLFRGYWSLNASFLVYALSRGSIQDTTRAVVCAAPFAPVQCTADAESKVASTSSTAVTTGGAVKCGCACDMRLPPYVHTRHVLRLCDDLYTRGRLHRILMGSCGAYRFSLGGEGAAVALREEATPLYVPAQQSGTLVPADASASADRQRKLSGYPHIHLVWWNYLRHHARTCVPPNHPQRPTFARAESLADGLVLSRGHRHHSHHRFTPLWCSDSACVVCTHLLRTPHRKLLPNSAKQPATQPNEGGAVGPSSPWVTMENDGIGGKGTCRKVSWQCQQYLMLFPPEEQGGTGAGEEGRQRSPDDTAFADSHEECLLCRWHLASAQQHRCLYRQLVDGWVRLLRWNLQQIHQHAQSLPVSRRRKATQLITHIYEVLACKFTTVVGKAVRLGHSEEPAEKKQVVVTSPSEAHTHRPSFSGGADGDNCDCAQWGGSPLAGLFSPLLRVFSLCFGCLGSTMARSGRSGAGNETPPSSQVVQAVIYTCSQALWVGCLSVSAYSTLSRYWVALSSESLMGQKGLCPTRWAVHRGRLPSFAHIYMFLRYGLGLSTYPDSSRLFFSQCMLQRVEPPLLSTEMRSLSVIWLLQDVRRADRCAVPERLRAVSDAQGARNKWKLGVHSDLLCKLPVCALQYVASCLHVTLRTDDTQAGSGSPSQNRTSEYHTPTHALVRGTHSPVEEVVVPAPSAFEMQVSRFLALDDMCCAVFDWMFLGDDQGMRAVARVLCSDELAA